MKWSVARGIALTLAAMVAACGGWLLLAPTAVGGPMSLVITSGVSMQPTFHTGDLAVLHSSPGYRVGDIVGYHSPTLRGAVVMHRLVAGNENGWTTKGDHNTWLDPDHPTNADIVGKLWLHVPKGGFLLTRVLLPLAFVAFLCLLIPFKKRPGTDENGEPVKPATVRYATKRTRGQHAGRRIPASASAGPSLDWFTRPTCARVVAGGLALAIVGAIVTIMAYARPLQRTASVSRTSSTTVKFGWTGTSGATLIYPDGRVTDPDPIFSKVVNRLTMTADVTTPGHAVGSRALIATLSDTSGWSRQWSIDTTGQRTGRALRLSGTLDLNLLLVQVALVQSTTGVASPATLTLSVEAPGQSASAGPSLSFALSNVTLKPQGPLTVKRSSSTASQASVPAVVTWSKHAVRVSTLRHLGAIAMAFGLLVALGAGLLSRRVGMPTDEDRLLQLFARRVVHLADASAWEHLCLDVTEAQSLAAFAESPGAVLYVVGSGQSRILIAERGGTWLRYVPERAGTSPVTASEADLGTSVIPEQRTSAANDETLSASDAAST